VGLGLPSRWNDGSRSLLLLRGGGVSHGCGLRRTNQRSCFSTLRLEHGRSSCHVLGVSVTDEVDSPPGRGGSLVDFGWAGTCRRQEDVQHPAFFRIHADHRTFLHARSPSSHSSILISNSCFLDSVGLPALPRCITLALPLQLSKLSPMRLERRPPYLRWGVEGKRGS